MIGFYVMKKATELWQINKNKINSVTLCREDGLYNRKQLPNLYNISSFRLDVLTLVEMRQVNLNIEFAKDVI